MSGNETVPIERRPNPGEDGPVRVRRSVLGTSPIVENEVVELARSPRGEDGTGLVISVQRAVDLGGYWERHDGGPEYVLCTRGAGRLTVRTGHGVAGTDFVAGDFVVVPQGVDHHADIQDPLEVVVVQHVEGTLGWIEDAPPTGPVRMDPPYAPWNRTRSVTAPPATMPVVDVKELARTGELAPGSPGVTFSYFRGSDLGRYWERHEGGCEYAFVLAGRCRVTSRTTGGSRTAEAAAGDFFVVPRGVDHHLEILEPIEGLLIQHTENTVGWYE